MNGKNGFPFHSNHQASKRNAVALTEHNTKVTKCDNYVDKHRYPSFVESKIICQSQIAEGAKFDGKYAVRMNFEFNPEFYVTVQRDLKSRQYKFGLV